MRVWACVCISTYLYKTEMKSGTRFLEQLLGFHVVSPDLASHLPQPLHGGSFCFSRASVCWRDLEEAAFTGERKATIKSSKNLGEQNGRIQPGLLDQMKSFSSILMKRSSSLSAVSPCRSVRVQLWTNASVSRKHRITSQICWILNE